MRAVPAAGRAEVVNPVMVVATMASARAEYHAAVVAVARREGDEAMPAELRTSSRR
jgi:hypothetical protein